MLSATTAISDGYWQHAIFADIQTDRQSEHKRDFFYFIEMR